MNKELDEYDLYDLGIQYYEAKDYARAHNYFLKAYKKGHANATLYLGICYYHGRGVARDLKVATGLFYKAAEAGVADAKYNLAICYEYGYGVTQDLNEAFKYYIDAAAHDSKHAKAKLRKMPAPVIPKALTPQEKAKWDRYANEALDIYVKTNDESPNKMTDQKAIAFKMLEQGVAAGHVPSMYYLGRVYESYESGWIYQDKKVHSKRYEMLAKARQLGSVEAIREIGDYYLDGIIVEKDIDEAIRLYNKAIEKGDAVSYGALGYLYMWDTYGRQDWRKAFECYYKGAQKGITYCEYSLGTCYQDGRGVAHDARKALYWYKKAVDKKFPGAQMAYNICREMYASELY